MNKEKQEKSNPPAQLEEETADSKRGKYKEAMRKHWSARTVVVSA